MCPVSWCREMSKIVQKIYVEDIVMKRAIRVKRVEMRRRYVGYFLSCWSLRPAASPANHPCLWVFEEVVSRSWRREISAEGDGIRSGMNSISLGGYFYFRRTNRKLVPVCAQAAQLSSSAPTMDHGRCPGGQSWHGFQIDSHISEFFTPTLFSTQS